MPVSIPVSFDADPSELQGQLNQFASQAGGDAGSGFASSFRTAVGSVATFTATAVTGIVAAIGGLAIGGGIERALAIENAEAKLLGLGNSAEDVTQIMENALGSVQGTAFGLGDAATVAAGLVAAGIQQGTELESVLSTVADTAQISGRSLTDIGAIFGSVAARGKLMGDDLLQLTSQGVPALQFLAEQLGVTSAEVSEMVSRGEVDFETFAAAMEAGLGGAALSAGDTFTGALANVRAALGRLGADAATPALDSLRLVFLDAIPAIDSVTESLSPLITQLAERLAPVIADLSGRFFDFISGIDFSSIGSGLEGLGPIIAPLAGLFAALGSGSLASALGPLGSLLPKISGPLGLIIGLIGTMLSQSPALRESLGDAFTSILGALQSLEPVFTIVAGLVGSLAGTLGDTLATAINTVAPVIVQLINMLGPVLTIVLRTLAPIIMQVAGVLGQVLGAALTAIMPVILSLAQTVLPVLLQVFSAVAPVLSEVIAAVLPLANVILPLLISVINALLPVVETVFSALGPIIDAALGIVQGIIQVVTSAIQGDWSGVWEGIKQILSGIWNTIVAVVKGAVRILGSLISVALRGISSVWNSVWASVGATLSRVWASIRTGVSNGVSNVLDLIRSLPGRILSALGNLAQMGINAGRSIVNGIADGIRNAVSNVTGAISGVLDTVRDFLPFSPAKVGPFSGRGWSGFSGEAIMKDLAAGMKRAGPVAIDGTADIMGRVSAVIAPDGDSVGADSVGAGSVTINEYGPQTWAGKRREVEWAQKYSTSLRTFQDGAVAIA